MSEYWILGCILLLGNYPGLKHRFKYPLLWLLHWLIVANQIIQRREWNHWHTLLGGYLLSWVCEFRYYLITRRPLLAWILPLNYLLYWESCHLTWDWWVVKWKCILFPSARCGPIISRCSWIVNTFIATIITIFCLSLENLKLVTIPPFFSLRVLSNIIVVSRNKRSFSLCFWY